MDKKLTNTEILVDVIVEAMQNVKAENIISLDLREIPNAVTDFFIVCHGNSNTQVEAIAKSIERHTRDVLKEKPWHHEGNGNAQWILMDYVNVVAHIFYKEAREFYNIEGLWADAKVETFEYLT